jgi:hypothetical protein
MKTVLVTLGLLSALMASPGFGRDGHGGPRPCPPRHDYRWHGGSYCHPRPWYPRYNWYSPCYTWYRPYPVYPATYPPGWYNPYWYPQPWCWQR